MGLRVSSSGLSGDWGLGFRVQDLGFGVWGLGFEFQSVGFGGWGLGLRFGVEG